MADTVFSCPACNAKIQIEHGTQDLAGPCPNCAAPLEAYFLPAYYKPMEVGALATPLADHTDSSCFFHPQKQAVRVCDGCGRMICALCDIDMGAEHLCPSCIAAGRKKKTLTTLEDRRTRYDSLVLLLGVLCFFMYPISFILAPIALYMTVRYWKAPGSLLGSSHTRFIIGCLLAVGMFAFTLLVFGLAARSHPTHRTHTAQH